MVPGSKSSRPSHRGEGWQPAAAGNKLRMQKQQVQLAGERCREPGESWKQPEHREIGGSSPARVGSALQGLPLMAGVLPGLIHGGLSPAQSVMSNEHLQVRAAIQQRHLHGWT